MTTSQASSPGAVPATFPANELERIQKLLSYDILDTASETIYDDITEIAVYICGTATSLVSLVDASRQWFKSTVGLDAAETPRDMAFCAHAILRPEVLVVPDARADKRFANNPLVTGAPYIRFYAGAPLITAEGYAVGTLCVVDYAPKQLSSKQIHALESLARQVVSHLEARLTVQCVHAEIAKQRKAEAKLRRVNVALKEHTLASYQKNKQLEQAFQELRLTQSQLVQQEKMAGLGQLVAGIAHEINNPVGFIAGNIGPAKRYATDLLDLIGLYQTEYATPSKTIQAFTEKIDLAFLSRDFTQLLGSMQMGSKRIATIVEALRTFSHLDESGKKLTDVHAGLESTLTILQHRLNAQADRPEIQVFKNLASLPLVTCYAASLNQVFMHVLVNAIDALEELHYNQPTVQQPKLLNSQDKLADSWTPKITITSELLEEREVVITVSDNGIGVSDDIKDGLFDPFFTTKPVGSGTGLGLSISHAIVVEQHRGRLECLSEQNKGTHFVIRFPLLGDRLS